MKIKLIMFFNFFFCFIPLLSTTIETGECVLGAASQLSQTHFDERGFQQKVNAYVHKQRAAVLQWALGKECAEVKRMALWVLDHVESIDARKSLRTIIKQLLQLSAAIDRMENKYVGKDGITQRLDQLRAVLAVKTGAILCRHARKQLICVLNELHEHIAYWEYQQNHQFYYLVHKSPVKFFGKKTQQEEIRDNVRILYGARQEHFRILGEFICASRAFDEHVSVLSHYEWAGNILSTVQAMCGRPHLWRTRVGTHESFIEAVKDVAPALARHYKTMDKAIYRAKKPGHFTRHWMSYSAGAMVTGATAYYFYNNPGKINEWHGKLENVYHKCKNTVADPVQKIQRAIFSDTDESTKKVKEAFDEIDQAFKPGNDISLEKKQEAYSNLAKRFRSLAYPKGEEEYKSLVQQGIKGLEWKTDEDIAIAAQKLDKTFVLGPVLTWFSLFADKTPGSAWGNMTFKETSPSIAATIKELPQLGVLLTHVFRYHGGKMAESARKVADVTVRDGTDVLRLLRLGIGALTLGFVYWGVSKGVPKLLNLVTPSPYDDTPIKDAIICAQDLMDDCKYLGQTRNMDCVQIGQLFYYLTRIRIESKHLDANDAKQLLRYLRRVELADSVDGKRTYLQRLYREYKTLHKAA